MNALLAFVAGGIVFGAGFLSGRATQEPVPPSNDAAASSDRSRATPASESSALQEITSRLQSIADRLQQASARPAERIGEKPDVDAASTVEAIGQLEERIKAMLEDVRLQTASLVEVERLKPKPDIASLQRLWNDCHGDASAIMLRINGVGFDDATRSFGLPTIKRAKGDPSSRVMEWLWDMPGDDKALLLEFDLGVVRWGGFVSRNALESK